MAGTTISIERDGGRLYLAARSDAGRVTLPLSTREAQTLAATITQAAAKESETDDAQFIVTHPLELKLAPTPKDKP